MLTLHSLLFVYLFVFFWGVGSDFFCCCFNLTSQVSKIKLICGNVLIWRKSWGSLLCYSCGALATWIFFRLLNNPLDGFIGRWELRERMSPLSDLQVSLQLKLTGFQDRPGRVVSVCLTWGILKHYFISGTGMWKCHYLIKCHTSVSIQCFLEFNNPR